MRVHGFLGMVTDAAQRRQTVTKWHSLSMVIVICEFRKSKIFVGHYQWSKTPTLKRTCFHVSLHQINFNFMKLQVDKGIFFYSKHSSEEQRRTSSKCLDRKLWKIFKTFAEQKSKKSLQIDNPRNLETELRTLGIVGSTPSRERFTCYGTRSSRTSS